MKYKTDTELQDTNSQPVIKRNQGNIESEQYFNEICEIIKLNYSIDITTDNDMQKQKKLQQDLDFCDEYECKINNKHDIELCPFLADDYEEEEW